MCSVMEMHFSIPETEECTDESGSYTLYKIYINGAHYCSVRFSQLYNLNEQLKKEINEQLPLFPPKKIFSLSSKDKDDRKLALEKYLQRIGQLSQVLTSDYFFNFLINSQKETLKEPDVDIELNVYLVNSIKVEIDVKTYELTENVLEKIVNKLGLCREYTFYFGLFLVKKEMDESVKIVRKLQEFESPYIVLKSANRSDAHKILVKKSIFELSFELEMYDDNVAIELMYIQALDEMEKGSIFIDCSVQSQLDNLKEKNFKKEFLKVISTQKFYGCVHFRNCWCNYPIMNTKTLVTLGNRTMYFRTFKKGEVDKEITFKITRIKCWKVTGVSAFESNGKKNAHMELSFEYLFAKDCFKWVTIITDQAIFMSMCLQNIVDEIILKKDGKRIKRPWEKKKIKSKMVPFLTRHKTLIYPNAPDDKDITNRNNEQKENYFNIPLNESVNFSKNDLIDNDEFITNDDL